MRRTTRIALLFVAAALLQDAINGIHISGRQMQPRLSGWQKLGPHFAERSRDDSDCDRHKITKVQERNLAAWIPMTASMPFGSRGSNHAKCSLSTPWKCRKPSFRCVRGKGGASGMAMDGSPMVGFHILKDTLICQARIWRVGVYSPLWTPMYQLNCAAKKFT